MVKKNNMLC